MIYDKIIYNLNKIHNNYYKYGDIKKINNRNFIKITCPKHGDFFQRIDAHMSGQICKKCSIENKKNNKFIDYKYIIDKCINKHNGTYKYPPGQIFKTMKSNIDIMCTKHGIFTQVLHNHLVNGNNCPKCANEKRNKNFKNTDVDIKDMLIKIYKNQNNIEINDINYNNNRSNINLWCKKHGLLQLQYGRAIGGQGCKYCNEENRLEKEKENFIKQSNILWNSMFDYSEVEYKGINKKVKLIYNNREYYQTPYNHLKMFSPLKNRSNGELIIENILLKKKIYFIREKTFVNLRHKKLLRFDFYLPNSNICIEFDGIQHYNPPNRWGGFNRLLYYNMLDKLKNEYCFNNNIKLIRIPYKDVSNIEKIIDEDVK